MSAKDGWIKHCPECNSMIPIKADLCEFCGHEFLVYELTEEEQLISFESLTAQINKAFYRLEGFMSGLITNCNSFDFVHNFDILFIKAKQEDTFTYKKYRACIFILQAYRANHK